MMIKYVVPFCATLLALGGGAESVDIITSEPVTDWGDWAEDFERCPEGRAAQGFQLQVESWTGLIDDTALNGIKLFCGNPFDGVTPTVTSSVGNWGKWGKKFRCTDQGYITGFQLRVEAGAGFQDETATNNIRIFCSESEPIDGDGERFGAWGMEKHCPAGHVVCGIKTQVQVDQGNISDDTALNNIAMECCPSPSLN